VATADVDRPAVDVFTCTTDPTRFPERQAGVVSGRLDGGGDEVGAVHHRAPHRWRGAVPTSSTAKMT
jgi:hypothetical protein